MDNEQTANLLHVIDRRFLIWGSVNVVYQIEDGLV